MYSGINHNQLENCAKRLIQCVICIKAYKLKNYKYGVTKNHVKIAKIYIYVALKYANCDNNHQAITFKF